MKLIFPLIVLLLTSQSFARTSKESREDKVIEASVENGYDYLFNTTQVGLGYYLNADNVLGLRAGQGKSDDEAQTSFSLYWKHFFGNSFYLMSDLNYLNSTEKDFLSGLFFNNDTTYRYTSLGAHVRIGNQWTFGNFNLGVDWFGIGHRLVTLKRENESEVATTFTLANIRIGFNF